MATKISGSQLVHIGATDPTNIIDFEEGKSGYTFFDSAGSGFFILHGVPLAQGASIFVSAADLDDFYLQFGGKGDEFIFITMTGDNPAMPVVVSPDDIPPEPELFTSGADTVLFGFLTPSQAEAIEMGADLYNALTLSERALRLLAFFGPVLGCSNRGAAAVEKKHQHYWSRTSILSQTVSPQLTFFSR